MPRQAPAKPRPVVCVFCQAKIPSRRRSGALRVGSYFCSSRCEKELASKLGLDLDQETMEVVAGGSPAEIFVFFGLKAGRLIWDAYKKRRPAQPESEPGSEQDQESGSGSGSARETREQELVRLLAELGLEPASHRDDVEREYRRLAKLRHPDVVGGSKAAMQALNATVARLRELLP